jgi:transcriptional regulator with XRE-family HTH domain
MSTVTTDKWTDMSYNLKMRAAAIIRAARLRAGLTQAELGARVGRDASEVSRWERGAVAPSFDLVGELVAACGLELVWSLFAADDSFAANIAPRLAMSPQARLDAGLAHSRRTQRLGRIAASRATGGDRARG